MGWVIQRPPLTIQESATQVKVFVSVYYQTEEEGPVPVGELPAYVQMYSMPFHSTVLTFILYS